MKNVFESEDIKPHDGYYILADFERRGTIKSIAIPGLEVENNQFVPIRELFESQGGVVSWDNDNNTLLSDYINIDLNMQIDIKQLINAIAAMAEINETEEMAILEGPMSLGLKMKGDYQLYDYGVELELPDLSNAISQEEYMQQLMEQMKQIEASEGLIEPETVEEP